MTLTTMPRPATRARDSAAVTMKALVYRGPGKKALEERPKPEITAATDAIVKIVKTTICGTNLTQASIPFPKGRMKKRW
jgi:alcohol dehydrogenase